MENSSKIVKNVNKAVKKLSAILIPVTLACDTASSPDLRFSKKKIIPNFLI